jgi:uncharacterized protein (DUF58 family)
MRFVPTTRLIRLFAAGAPLWLVTVWLPGGLVLPLASLGLLLWLCVQDVRRLPDAAALRVRRDLPRRLSLATEHRVGLTVVNASRQQLHLRLRDEIPEVLGSQAPRLEGWLAPQQTVRWSYVVCPRRRGLHTYGDVVVRLEHRYGLLQRQLRLSVPDTVKVYPRFVDMHDYALLARIDRRDDTVRRPRYVRGRGSEFESLRPYTTGDDLRLVDWKASARQGTLISRNLRVERGQHLAVLVDAGRLMLEALGGFSRFEHALNATVMLSYVAQHRGDSLAVATFSNRLESFLPPTRGPQTVSRVLESIYRVEPRALEADYWRVVAEVMGRLKRRSLVIMLTDVLDTAGSTGLVTNLARAASKHLVLCVVMRNPHTAALADAAPTDVEAAYAKAAACQLELRRQLALASMRAKGIRILESEPEHFSIQLVRRYLDIRQKDLQ